jgi:hypothetical protein
LLLLCRPGAASRGNAAEPLPVSGGFVTVGVGIAAPHELGASLFTRTPGSGTKRKALSAGFWS